MRKIGVACGEAWRFVLLADSMAGTDPERAEWLYEQAIQAGDERYATNGLANLIEEDEPERAEALYERSIAAGNVPDALSNLAYLLFDKDPKRAEDLYERAIEAGDEYYATNGLARLMCIRDSYLLDRVRRCFARTVRCLLPLAGSYSRGGRALCDKQSRCSYRRGGS